MQTETKQELNAGQVICERCGEFCKFDCDKCPACGAPLFDNDLQLYDEDSTKDTRPLILKLPAPPDLHYTEPKQLSEANSGLQIKLCILLLIACILVCSIIILL